MTQVVIDDIIPRTQLIAAASQTVFNTNWTADEGTDVNVYARADGVEPDDITQLVSTSLYNVTFVGGSQTVRVTFLSGRALNDVITIVRNTPAERTNLYINTNFVPSMLNQDFGILTLVDQQNQMYDTEINPRYNVSATIEPDSINGGGDIVIPILPPGFGWRKNFAGTEIEAISIPDGGFAPAAATYLIKTASAGLPNAQVMASLASGFTANTTSTGVQLSRVFQGTTREIDISIPDGIAGDPVWSISDDVILPGIQGIGLIKGTTAERPVTPGANTYFRFNTDDEFLEYFDGSDWIQLIEDAGVLIIHGTNNQIDVDSTDPEEPIISLSATLNVPGTFTIQASTAVDSIINDNTMATATATNLATSLSIKNYINGLDVGNVKSVSGVSNRITSTGGQNPIIDIAATYVGQTSITTLGTITTGLWHGSVISEIYGGTNQSSYAAGDMLYASAANTLSKLAKTNSACMVTNASGVPAWSATMTDGKLLIGATGGTPQSASITPGFGIVVTAGGNSITISASGAQAFIDQTTGSASMSINTGYVSDAGASLVSYALPSNGTYGSWVEVCGLGTGLWKITQSVTQQIVAAPAIATTLGTSGNLASVNRYDSVRLRCISSNSSLWEIASQNSTGLTYV